MSKDRHCLFCDVGARRGPRLTTRNVQPWDTPHQNLTDRLWCLLIIVCFLLSGCASRAEFDHVVYLPSVKVHIVSHRALIPSQNPDVMGYQQGREIWVLGRKDEDGNYMINEMLLGHEIYHVLDHTNMNIHHPDKPILWSW